MESTKNSGQSLRSTAVATSDEIPEAEEELLPWWPEVVAVVDGIVGEPQQVQAITAGVFQESPRSGDEEGRGAPLGIFRRAVRRALASPHRVPGEQLRSLTTTPVAYGTRGHHRIPLGDWSPRAAALGERDLLETTRRLLRTVPLEYRVALLLRDVAGLSTTTTSQVLDLAESVVAYRVHAARLHLRQMMAGSLAPAVPAAPALDP